MLDRIRAAIPPTILVLCAWNVADVALDAYQTYQFGTREPSWEAIRLASTALWVVVSLLLPLGLHELALRRTGVERTLITAAAAVTALLAVQTVVQIYLDHVDPPSYRWLRSYWTWSQRLNAGGMLTAAVLLALAAAQRGPRGIVAGVALVITTAMAFRFSMVHEWLIFDNHLAHRWFNLALVSGYAMAFRAALLTVVFLLGDRAPPRPTEPGVVARSLEHIGTALVARVVIVIGVAVFTAMAVGSRSPGLIKVILVLAPLGLLLSMIAQIVATFGLSTAAGGPRLRLAAGASLTLATMVVTTIQAIIAFRAATDRSDSGGPRLSAEAARGFLEAWPYLLPALALLGLLLLLSGVASLRRRQPGLDAEAPTVAAAWLIGASLGAVLLQRHTPKSASEFVLLALAVAACNVVAVLAVARVCHKTAWAIAAGDPALPSARVVSGDRNPM